jgi:hypothetical protein
MDLPFAPPPIELGQQLLDRDGQFVILSRQLLPRGLQSHQRPSLLDQQCVASLQILRQ